MRTVFLFPALILTLLFASVATMAGPPFQTDDPQPVDYGHYELYLFSGLSTTVDEIDPVGPAMEFNWGALPNVQLHLVIPAAAALPSGEGADAFGLGDIETGIKFRFVQETKHRPMIGIFPLLEVPTGNPAKGLGVGQPWAKLPIWIQKSWGPWTTYGGGGEQVVEAPGSRSFPFGGWLVQRNIGKKLTLGAEIFSHGPAGAEFPDDKSVTEIDVGGFYYFRNPGFQLLFAYGHTPFGRVENYAYLGLYWTWGGKSGKNLVSWLHR